MTNNIFSLLRDKSSSASIWVSLTSDFFVLVNNLDAKFFLILEINLGKRNYQFGNFLYLVNSLSAF